MNKKNILNLIFNILAPLLLSFLVALATKDDIAYLDTLNRNIVVPNFVFPVVWSVLYILMGIWAHFYEKDGLDKKGIVVYWISLFLNLMFSFFLFTFHLNVVAFVDVVILLVLIIYLFTKTLLNNKKYAYLLIPYILWLCFAFALMLDIVINN